MINQVRQIPEDFQQARLIPRPGINIGFFNFSIESVKLGLSGDVKDFLAIRHRAHDLLSELPAVVFDRKPGLLPNNPALNSFLSELNSVVGGLVDLDAARLELDKSDLDIEAFLKLYGLDIPDCRWRIMRVTLQETAAFEGVKGGKKAIAEAERLFGLNPIHPSSGSSLNLSPSDKMFDPKVYSNFIRWLSNLRQIGHTVEFEI